MEFRLTYEGKLLAHKGGRAGHVHEIRQEFHKQLKVLWDEHPVLKRGHPSGPTIQEPNEVWGKTFPPGWVQVETNRYRKQWVNLRTGHLDASQWSAWKGPDGYRQSS